MRSRITGYKCPLMYADAGNKNTITYVHAADGRPTIGLLAERSFRTNHVQTNGIWKQFERTARLCTEANAQGVSTADLCSLTNICQWRSVALIWDVQERSAAAIAQAAYKRSSINCPPLCSSPLRIKRHSEGAEERRKEFAVVTFSPMAKRGRIAAKRVPPTSGCPREPHRADVGAQRRDLCPGAHHHSCPRRHLAPLSSKTRAKLRDACIALCCVTVSFLMAVFLTTLLFSLYPDYCCSMNISVE
uniref:Uncharacterized protein n=1 Tax=Trichuris muris TaxID=70415 RepID=A0A5S6Q6X6_TRIMR